MSKNLCVYCNSPAYGKGCPYSPTGVHFHPNNPKKCCYCGSISVGSGCPYNPHGNVHIHGIEYNTMVKETIDKSITLGYLMNSLSEPFTEMVAYKLGIIDKLGNKIKEPKTLDEHNAYTQLERYIIQLKQELGKKIGVINTITSIQLEHNISTEDYKSKYNSISTFKEKLSNINLELIQSIRDAFNSGLNQSIIEKLIIESIIEKND